MKRTRRNNLLKIVPIANIDGSRCTPFNIRFEPELDDESVQENLPTKAQLFVRKQADHQFLCALADGQYTFDEVAEQLGLPDRTVAWKRWDRRRRKLKSLFQKED